MKARDALHSGLSSLPVSTLHRVYTDTFSVTLSYDMRASSS